MTYTPESTNQLLQSRRSIFPKWYTGEKVDDSTIQQMLENANWAPTHKYTEPWRFTVFSGEGLKTLANFQAELYKEKATADGTYLAKKYDNLKHNPLLASHIIALGMRRDPEEKIREVEEISSVAMAMQNMHLTAAAYGVGCYWATGGITYFEETKAYFGLGPNDRFMGFVYVGIPQPELNLEGKRGPVDKKTTWVTE